MVIKTQFIERDLYNAAKELKEILDETAPIHNV